MNWLLLIHQIPAKPTYFRAKIWRRLQQVGAVPVKQAAYAMPMTEQAYEDLTWIVKEILQGGGEAILLEARFREGMGDDQVINLFREARKRDYEKIAIEANDLLSHYRQNDSRQSSSFLEYKSGLSKLRKAFAGITAIDFFPVPERATVEATLADMETILREKNVTPSVTAKKPVDRTALTGKIWVTRANVYVDRMASAWLIQRYIDHEAGFRFVGSADFAPGPEEIRFDMPTGQFTHEGELCTFEVMARQFGAADPALAQIALIIHDIDLKDDTYNLPETDGVHALFDGIVATTDDDRERIRQAGIILDGLLAFFRNRGNSRP
jgi:hypothetical protein